MKIEGGTKKRLLESTAKDFLTKQKKRGDLLWRN